MAEVVRTPVVKRVTALLEWTGLLVAGALCLWLGGQIGSGAREIGWGALMAAACVPMGIMAAALFTGFGHFFADNFADIDTPILGPTFIFRFRQHHDHPMIICGLSFRELNGGLALLSLPLLAGAVALPAVGTLSGLLLQVFTLSAALATAATNQIHRWAHDPARPAWVVPLQRRGIILSPVQHARHHRAPFHIAFCITNGWLDPLLDRWKVWHRVADALLWISVPRIDDSVMGSDRGGGKRP